MSWLSVGIGAVFGAWGRWRVGLILNPIFPTIPLGTLFVNLLGSYLIGIMWVLSDQASAISVNVRLGIIAGFLGSFTTFSTFSAETVRLLSTERYLWALLMIGAQVGGALLMTGLGIATVHAFRAH